MEAHSWDEEAVVSEGTPWDIRERSFSFAVSIVRLCRTLDRRRGADGVLSRQLLRAGTSIGANIEEGQAGQSRPDFINKYAIALKEARETIYWLRLLAASADASDCRIMTSQEESREQSRSESPYVPLITEAKEIAKVIGAIIVKTKSRAS